MSNKQELMRMSQKELLKLCKKLNTSPNGTKHDIILNILSIQKLRNQRKKAPKRQKTKQMILEVLCTKNRNFLLMDIVILKTMNFTIRKYIHWK